MPENPNKQTDQILLSNSSNNSPKCPLEFFRLPFFLKSNLMLNFFYIIAVFDLLRQSVPKILYYQQKNQIH